MHCESGIGPSLILASCITVGLLQGCGAAPNQRNQQQSQSGVTQQNDQSAGASSELESEASSAELNPELVSPDAPIRGKTHTEWAVTWWRWIWSTPADVNPQMVLDTDCDVNQQADVF